MCIYRYVYYTNCQHGELIRLSYCDKAKALGLPAKHDRWHGGSPGAAKDDNKDKEPSHAPGPSSHNRSAASSSTRDTPHPSSRGRQTRPHTPPMSAMAPPKAALARSRAHASSHPTEEYHHAADRIPRSVHSDTAPIVPVEHVASHDYHQPASPTSSPLDTADYHRVNINIPMDPYSDFTMKLTHEDGKVQEIVTRFESLSVRDGSNRLVSDDIHVRADDARDRSLSASTVVQTESDTETETLREFPSHPGTHDLSSDLSRVDSSPFSVGEHDLASSAPSGMSPTGRAGAGNTLSRQSSKKKGKVAESNAGETDEAESHSPRKPIPTRWAVPSLATAQRALQRESRKRASQSDIPAPAAVGRKSIRGTRLSVDAGKLHGTEATTFLTKAAVEPVESDITTQALKRSPSNRLRQSASKTSLKSPSGSPLRGSPGNNSTIQITVSPSRHPRGSIPSFDGPNHSSTMDRLADSSKHARAPSSICSGGGYVTARQSPVSEGSMHSYQTAPCQLHDDVSEYDLANDGDREQLTKKDGTKPHSRGKSEPHVKISPATGKTTATRPSAPSLSLRIPQSSSVSTERRSPLTSGSAPNSASGTPTSPTHSSRIPRIHPTVQEEPERATATLRRSKSAKALSGSVSARELQHVQSPQSHHSENKHTTSPAEVEPRFIPLPETPVPQASQAFRHVRTLNSEGVTPILSSASSKLAAMIAAAGSNVSSEADITPLAVRVSAKAPTAQSALGKHTMIESYLENTQRMSDSDSDMDLHETASSSGSDRIPKVPERNTVTLPLRLKAIENTTELPTAMEECPVDDQRGELDQDFADDHQGQDDGIPDSKPDDEGPRDKGDNSSHAPDKVEGGSHANKPALVMAQPQQPQQHDPVLNDSAVVYSRMKSDILGNSRSDPPVDDSSSVDSPNLRASSTVASHQDKPIGNGGLEKPSAHDRKQTASEGSLMAKLATGLSAEAKEFVPTAPTIQDQPDASDQWAQAQQPPMFQPGVTPFDPFAVDTYGNPMYHLMYPIQVGPGTPYDWSCFVPYHTSPRRGKKKPNNWSPKRGRQSRSDNTSGSPTKTQRIDATDEVTEPREAQASEQDMGAHDGGDSTPRPAVAALARSVGIDPEHLHGSGLDATEKASDKEAFAAQMETVTRLDALRLSEGATGRASRFQRSSSPMFTAHFTESGQHQQEAAYPPRAPRDNRVFGHPHNDQENVPYAHHTLPFARQTNGNYNRYPRPHNARSGLYPFSHNTGMYENRQPSRFDRYRNRHWNAGAGVPLSETDFPTPVAPPGPRPADVGLEHEMSKASSSTANEYVGYSTVKEPQTCGEMNIVGAAEWHGNVCNSGTH